MTSLQTSNRMRESAAELTPEQFREAGHRLVDQIAEFLSTLADKPVAPSTSPHELRALIGGGAATLYDQLKRR